MTFNEVLSQTIAMRQQHARVSYRALKRQVARDNAFLPEYHVGGRVERTPPVCRSALYSPLLPPFGPGSVTVFDPAPLCASPSQKPACGFPAHYVFEHIMCGMWPTQLCGARVAEAHGDDSHDG